MAYPLHLTNVHALVGPPILAFAGAGPAASARPAPQGEGAAGSTSTLVLQAQQGPLAGRQIPVSVSPFTVGRNPDNSLVLPGTQVSRHHVRLELREGRWFLQDLDSANGTFVNRQRLSSSGPVPLNRGDVIGIGESVFTALFRVPAQPPRAAQAAGKPRRVSPIAAILVGLVLVAVIAAVVWVLIGQVDKEEEVTPGLGLPTVTLPDINLPTLQIPTVTLPTLEIPAGLPIPTAVPEMLAPLQTAVPGLKLPKP